MSHHDSNLKGLLSPARSGTFFAPFRSRSANPDGFDSKMKLWILAIDEWAVSNKKLTLSLEEIHKTFISDAGVRPDKECIRLVFSEMKRRSQLVLLKTLKTSSFWTSSRSSPLLDNFIDPKGWFGWGMKKLVVDPASWAVSTIVSTQEQAYSDLTDMSITDNMKFVNQKSLNILSQDLLAELIRISKAEKQVCFEWQHLLELITPILNTIIDATHGKELLETLDILIEYLAIRKHVAIQIDNDTKLVKISNPDDSSEDDVMVTKKDVAMARLLRAKELLTTAADKYHDQAQRAKKDALECYTRKEIVKAKSLLRSHKRLTACADQKEAQLTNVEIMLEQLENTDSNMMIIQAYKDGAEALKIANTNLEGNTTILDDMYDATAEARHLNDEMNQMLKDISCVSQGIHDTSSLEAELNEYLATRENVTNTPGKKANTSRDGDTMLDDLSRALDELVVCQDEPIIPQENTESTQEKEHLKPSTAT